MYNKHNQAVAKFAAKTCVKPVLASVLFTNEKTIATDSSRLLEVSSLRQEDDSENIDPTLILADSVRVIQLPKKRPTFWFKTATKKLVEIMTRDERGAEKVFSTNDIIDEEFPDYEQLFPTEFDVEIIMNGKLLGEMLTEIGKMSKRSSVTIKIKQGKPVVLISETDEGQKVRGLIMQQRK